MAKRASQSEYSRALGATAAMEGVERPPMLTDDAGKLLLRIGDQIVEAGGIPLPLKVISEDAPLFDELADHGLLTYREVLGDFGSGSRLYDGTVFTPKGRNVHKAMKESATS